MNNSFTDFKTYAQFLLNNYLDELGKDLVKKAHEANLPVLKLLAAKLSEEEIIQLSKKGLAEDILKPVVNGSPFDQIKKGIENWKANAIIIPKDQLFIEDVTSVNNTRKRALLSFINYYDCSKEVLINLIKEIDDFFEISINMGLKAYEEIQRAELKDKGDMLNGILTHIPIVVTRIDKKGNILYSVGAGLKGLGLKDGGLTGQNIFEAYPNANNTSNALNGNYTSFVASAKSVTGETREFQTFYIPEKNNILGFSIDITQQRQAQEIFKTLVDGVRDYAIFILSPEGKVVSWNEGAKRLKGYTEAEIVGKHFSVFYTQEKKDQKFLEYELEQARKWGRFEDEGLRVKKDGTTFYANVVVNALYDTDKNLIGFSKITRDLTERRRYEESLHKLNTDLEKKVKERTEELSKSIDQLKKINNDLDNFIYTASHDLKAPVSNIEGLIIGLFDELSQQTVDKNSLDTFKKMIETSILRFQATIRDLTEIAKIQKGTKDNVEDVDLNELLEDIKISIGQLIAQSGAEIRPEISECKKIKFVRKNLKSIFYNLISNSIKYQRPDKKPVITIKCTVEKGYIAITFTDNGLGIKTENQDKIFTMFKRFHDHVEGTGIGLYIVKRIIENSGGKIEVTSLEGVGSVFKVYLPIIYTS